MTRDFTTLPYSEYTTYAYDSNRAKIDRVVIHSTVCTTQVAINTFSSPNATTSAHYIIGNDGSLHAGLEETEVAYHSGNYAMNQRSIGIEHEWYSGIHPTDALYKKSGALVKDICQFYGLPINSTTVIPHKAVVATSCPNEIDVNRIISEANGAQPPTDDCPAKLLSITAERDKLNGVITGKDATITSLNQQIQTINAQVSSLQATVSNQEKTLLNDQATIASLTETAKLVPALQQQVTDLTDSRASYMKQLSACQTQVGKIRASLIPKKYLSLKLYNFLMTLE